MNIPELKEAVNKSDMNTEAKAEITEILRYYMTVAELALKGDYGD